MLCENCQQSALRDDSPAFRVETNIFGHRSVVTDEDSTVPTNYFLLDHLPELPQLRESALSGCELCSFLRESILSRDTAKFLQDDEGIEITSLEEEITLQTCYHWNRTVDDTNERRHYLQVIVNFMETDLEFFISCVIGAAEKGDPVAKWLHLDDPSTKALNRPKTMRWIKERIRDCKEHDHRLPTPVFVPKLLLDVRGEIPKLTDQDTLISTQKARGQLKTRTPRYTALSYCWGTAEDAKVQVKTTTSSFAERQTGIETKDITPVLQDAIIVTRQLSIPYLWIDSLCIFQDDITDWNRQCMDMDKIYGHAEITIRAASSTSCREGFIKRKVPQIRLPYHSALNQALQGSMWIELQEVGLSLAPLPSSIYNDVAENRLATRGWAFQERVLSTRQIIFGKSDTHFIRPQDFLSYSSRSALGHYGSSIHHSRTLRDVQELYHEWANLLVDFSSIHADSYTCATDLLPSIAGLAVEFAKRLKDDYFAGHWGNDLVMGLMWSTDGSRKVSKSVYLGRVCSPIQYLVPSWSQLFGLGFTSTLRGNMWGRLYHPAVKSIDAHTVTEGCNAFGAINNGELRVCGYHMDLQATNVIQFKSIEPWYSTYRADQIDVWRLKFGQSDDRDFFCDVLQDYYVSTTDIHEEVKLWKLILLGTCKEGPGERVPRQTVEHEEDMYPFGLVVHGIKHSEWCRIGIFIPANKGPSLSLENFKMASTLGDITII